MVKSQGGSFDGFVTVSYRSVSEFSLSFRSSSLLSCSFDDFIFLFIGFDGSVVVGEVLADCDEDGGLRFLYFWDGGGVGIFGRLPGRFSELVICIFFNLLVF